MRELEPCTRGTVSYPEQRACSSDGQLAPAPAPCVVHAEDVTGVQEDKAHGSGLEQSDRVTAGCSPCSQALYTSPISRCSPADKKL